MNTPQDIAANPYTPAQQLSDLAYQQPQLQPIIAQNPAVPRDLLDWISQWGTPEGQAAANARISSLVADAPTEMLQPTSPGGDQTQVFPAASAQYGDYPAQTQVQPAAQPGGYPGYPAQQGGPLPQSEPAPQKKKSLLWLWILLGVLAVAVVGLIVWFATSDGPADVIEEVVVEEPVEVPEEPAPIETPEETPTPPAEQEDPESGASAFLGTWHAIEMSADGITITEEELKELEAIGFFVSLDINADGKFVMAFPDDEEDDVEKGSWEILSPTEILLLSEDGTSVTGVLDGAKMTIDDPDFRMVLTKR